jgi:hypothetical protein
LTVPQPHRIALAAVLLLTTLHSRASAQVNHDPAAARLVTEDIPRFWAAFDARAELGTARAIDSLYFAPGTAGLKDWIRLRLNNANTLAATVDKVSGYYASARASTLRIAADEPKIRAAFTGLKAIYPDAVFPDVYFLIGRLSSGGTTSEHGLLIGAEMYGRTTDSALAGLGPWLRQVLSGVDRIPAIVAHELVHYQQVNRSSTLLAHSLREGSADFVAELLTHDNINAHVHAWVHADSSRELALWQEFSRDMLGHNYGQWFSSDNVALRPKDLGYFMGYRIAQAYYDNHSDKSAAIKEILTTTNAEALLRESGYGSRFK